MDVSFKCPHCEQELEVDASAAGIEISCPACGEIIVVPEPASGGEASPATTAEARAENAPAAAEGGDLGNSMNLSAAAREEKHYAVPVRTIPTEVLIKKASRPLEVAAQESDRRMRIKCIRHIECVEVGKDHFEEMVSDFLHKVGEKHIISVHTIAYTYVDMGTRQILTDYGVIIVYRG
jgi:ribosomal protein S27E